MYLFAIGSYFSGKEPSFVYFLQQPFKILNFELRAFDERHQLLLHQVFYSKIGMLKMVFTYRIAPS